MTDLINNAGISTPDHPKETVGSISRSQMMDVFNTNVAGVAAITSASGVLKSSDGKVINISSGMGSLSITKATSTYSPSYRCSKAAVNMLTVCFAKDFPGTSFATVHPGWVQTDMGGSGGRTADIGVEESARGIVQVAFDFILLILLVFELARYRASTVSFFSRCCLGLRIVRVDSLLTGKEKNFPGEKEVQFGYKTVLLY